MGDYKSIGALNRRLLVRKYVQKVPGLKTSEQRARAVSTGKAVGQGVWSVLQAGAKNVNQNYGQGYNFNYDVKYGGKKK